MKLIDLTGKRFGNWEVLRRGETRKGRPYWWCRCDCGTEQEVGGPELRKGDSTGCKDCARSKKTGRPKGHGPFEDLKGKKFRMLTVMYFGGYIGKHRAWWVKCDCGNEKLYREFALKSGRIKSCGCESTLYKPRTDLRGFRSHYLEGIEPGPHIGKHRGYICKCHACGQIVNIPEFHLTSGRYKSCGCVQYQDLPVRNTKHGMARTREYRIWRNMRRRCNDPKFKEYYNYGGRGIKVCKEWDNSAGFERFIKDMGLCPYPHYTLDRIDNDKGYEPSNCRWVPMRNNLRNRRNGSKVEFRGQVMPMEDFAELSGISSKSIRYHLKKGKNLEEILLHFEKEIPV